MRRSWVWLGMVFQLLPGSSGHTHGQLAGLEDAGWIKLVNGTLVAGLNAAQGRLAACSMVMSLFS